MTESNSFQFPAIQRVTTTEAFAVRTWIGKKQCGLVTTRYLIGDDPTDWFEMASKELRQKLSLISQATGAQVATESAQLAQTAQ